MWLLVLLLPLISKVTPAPTEIKRACPEFDSPWILTDIEVLYPAGAAPGSGEVSFNFYDENINGLQMATQCTGTVTGYKCEGDDSGYVTCANETVLFKLEESLVMVERSILDN